MADKMFKNCSKTPLPDHEDLTDLVKGFNSLLADKIINIMRNLVPMENNPTDSKYIEDQYTTDMSYSSFKQVTTETISNIIGNMPSKSCELEPLHIRLVQ